MTRNILLNALKEFTEAAVKDLIMPVRMHQGDTEQQYKCADVYLMRLPDGSTATKRAPYILHQIITGHDREGSDGAKSMAQVRSIFCVYHTDEQEGALLLLELMERVRIALLQSVAVGEQFQLDRHEGIETLIYPDDTAPYFAGEMVTAWTMPTVERRIIL